MEPIPQDIRLAGPLKPMRFEVDIEDCIVHGEIPRELHGGFYRCGPALKRLPRDGALGFPAMDGMIQGLIFENCFVNTSICAISRANLLTGQYPGRHRIDQRAGDEPVGR